MFFVFKLLLWPLAIYLGVNLIKELYSYSVWLRHYKAQGIPYEFTPMFGFVYYFLVDLHPKFEKMDALQKFMNPLFTKGDSLAKFRQVA